MDSKEKKEKIAFHFGKILETLGMDINDPSVAKTPFRVAKMYVDEVFSGLIPDNYPEISFHDEEVKNEIILVKNISLISFCEHHLVPMIGTAHASYLPSVGVLGLSKIHRIMRFYAKRPQLQERLTLQITKKLQEELKTEDVAVSIRMRHLCVLARGVEDHTSEVETHVLQGVFESDPEIRREFFLRISGNERLGLG